MELVKEQAEQERRRLAEQAKREKQESEASRKKMKEMEERARRMAAEAEAKAKEVATMQSQVRKCKYCSLQVKGFGLRLILHTTTCISKTHYSSRG